VSSYRTIASIYLAHGDECWLTTQKKRATSEGLEASPVALTHPTAVRPWHRLWMRIGQLWPSKIEQHYPEAFNIE